MSVPVRKILCIFRVFPRFHTSRSRRVTTLTTRDLTFTEHNHTSPRATTSPWVNDNFATSPKLMLNHFDVSCWCVRQRKGRSHHGTKCSFRQTCGHLEQQEDREKEECTCQRVAQRVCICMIEQERGGGACVEERARPRLIEGEGGRDGETERQRDRERE